MTRSNIAELSDAQVRGLYPGRVFKAAMVETPAIPGTFAGKSVCAVLVATNAALTETQMDALETAIEAITGVHKAYTLIGPARIPLDRVPAGHELAIWARAGFDIRPTP